MQSSETIKTDLSTFNNDWYHHGSAVKRFIWHYTSCFLFKNGLFPFYGLKVFILRIFGARIGKGVLIKPYVNIKYPWLLEMGDNIWIGEQVWIDNLAKVTIGSNACLSQGCFLLTGNHDYTKPSFDLMIGEINIQDGVWLGAKSIVCPGVTCGSQAVLSAGSLANKDLEAGWIYQGNPAQKLRERIISKH